MWSKPHTDFNAHKSIKKVLLMTIPTMLNRLIAELIF